MSFKWDEENVLLLIEKIHEKEIIWNPKNPDYKNRSKRTVVLNDIATLFGIYTSEIERKWKNLTSHYFRERKKYKESRRSGALDDVREPKWFAYKQLDFLRDKKTCGCVKEKTSQNIPTKWKHSPASGSTGNTMKSEKANQKTSKTTSQDSPGSETDDGTSEDEDTEEIILPDFIGNISLPSTKLASNARIKRVPKRKIVRDTNMFLAQKRKLTLDLLNHDIYLRKLQAMKLEKELGMGRSEYTQELEAVKGIKTENTLDMEFEYS